MAPESAEVCTGHISQYPTLFMATAYRFKLERSKHVLGSRNDDSGATLVWPSLQKRRKCVQAESEKQKQQL